MFGKTHITFGILLFLVIIKLFSVQNKLLFFLIIMVSSIFPDVDIGSSFLGKRIKFSLIFKHRGFFHSIFALILFSLLVYFIFDNTIYTLAFTLAYFFHLVLDALTPSGIKPFLLGFKINGFIESGSWKETILFLFICLINVFLVLSIFH